MTSPSAGIIYRNISSKSMGWESQSQNVRCLRVGGKSKYHSRISKSRLLDIVVVNELQRKAVVMKEVILKDSNTKKKDHEKFDKHQELK